MAELITELREHWDDGYWWADRQLLLAVCVAVAAGSIGLVFKLMELLLVRQLGGLPDGA